MRQLRENAQELTDNIKAWEDRCKLPNKKQGQDCNENRD